MIELNHYFTVAVKRASSLRCEVFPIDQSTEPSLWYAIP